jgi:hypothetical protein
MHISIRAIAALVVSLAMVPAAHADMRPIPQITGSDAADTAIVIGGLALSLGAILGGLLMVRRRRGRGANMRREDLGPED